MHKYECRYIQKLYETLDDTLQDTLHAIHNIRTGVHECYYAVASATHKHVPETKLFAGPTV